MKLIIKIGIALLIVIATAYWFLSNTKPTVLAAPAIEGTAVDAVTGTIKVFATKDIKLKSEYRGRIKDIPVRVGDYVSEGDVIVEMESSEIEVQLAQKRIRLEAAEARAAQGQTHELDIATLEDEIATIKQEISYEARSVYDLERKQRDLEKLQIWRAREQIDQQEILGLLRSEIEQLELQLQRMKIRSPFDGQVVEIYFLESDIIYPGNAAARVISNERNVELTLSEDDFAGAGKGQKASIRLAGHNWQTLVGYVDFIVPVADAANKTRKLFLKVEASPDILVPGISGEAVLTKAEVEDTVIIPRRALFGRLVYIVNPDSSVAIREVQPGYLSLNKAEVREGLEAGEMVVLEGQRDLAEGMAVKVELAE